MCAQHRNILCQIAPVKNFKLASLKLFSQILNFVCMIIIKHVDIEEQKFIVQCFLNRPFAFGVWQRPSVKLWRSSVCWMIHTLNFTQRRSLKRSLENRRMKEAPVAKLQNIINMTEFYNSACSKSICCTRCHLKAVWLLFLGWVQAFFPVQILPMMLEAWANI